MARFTPGDLATHDGRPVVIKSVSSRGRYTCFYTDDEGGMIYNATADLLSDRDGCRVCGREDTPVCPSCRADQESSWKQ